MTHLHRTARGTVNREYGRQAAYNTTTGTTPTRNIVLAIRDGHTDVPYIESDVLHRARLTVCRMATDVDDARELLAMLGIDPAAQAAAQTRPRGANPRPQRGLAGPRR